MKISKLSAAALPLLTMALALIYIGISPARATTITFGEGSGASYSGSDSEAGFAYSTLVGTLIRSNSGNPGRDMEGGGTLQVISETPSLFTFSSIDYANSVAGGGHFPLALSVYGLRDGLVVGVESYSLVNEGNFFTNWTTFGANVLAGVNIDELRININTGSIFYDLCFCGYHQAIDNIQLGAAASEASAPAPGAFALLGLGLLGFGATRRKVK